MPNVASDLKFHGLSRLQQQAARQAHASASPATTPFDSVLDETTRPDPAPRPQRAADGNAPRAERGQRAKSADRSDRAAKSDDKTRPSDADAPAKADSIADRAKTDNATAPDTKTADSKSTDTISRDKASDQTAVAEDISTADASQQPADAKVADAVAIVPIAVVVDPAATRVANTAPVDSKGEAKVENAAVAATAVTAATGAPAATSTTAADEATKAIAATTANAAATATSTDETAPKATNATVATAATAATPATPATASPKMTAAAGQPDATATDVSAEAALAQAQPNALATLNAKADNAEKTDKADFKNDKKVDTDKKASSAQTALKPAAPIAADAAQTDGEPAKDAGAHADAKTAANSHRGVAADVTTAATTPDTTVAAKSPDLTPPPGLIVQTPAAAQGAGALTATIAPTVIMRSDSSEPAVPIAGVAFEITSKTLSGRNQFDIRLDPPDLGRIHVRLDVDRDGNVITHMVADRTDTLDLLRKDTAGLERALQDAGLKTSDNSLQFSLRDQQANQHQRNSGGESAHVVIEDQQLAAIEPVQRNYARYNASTGGLDIRV